MGLTLIWSFLQLLTMEMYTIPDQSFLVFMHPIPFFLPYGRPLIDARGYIRPLRRPRRAAAADIFDTPPPPIFVCRRAAAADNLSARRRRQADSYA